MEWRQDDRQNGRAHAVRHNEEDIGYVIPPSNPPTLWGEEMQEDMASHVPTREEKENRRQEEMWR